MYLRVCGRQEKIDQRVHLCHRSFFLIKSSDKHGSPPEAVLELLYAHNNIAFTVPLALHPFLQTDKYGVICVRGIVHLLTQQFESVAQRVQFGNETRGEDCACTFLQLSIGTYLVLMS